MQALSAAIAADARYAAVYVDAGGVIRSWNRRAEMTFGHSADQAVGRRADFIVPDALRTAHWKGFDRAVRSNWAGATAWGAIEALHSSGRQLALEVFLIGLQSTTSGPLGGVLALFRAPR